MLCCSQKVSTEHHTHAQRYSTSTNTQGVVLVPLHEEAASLLEIRLHSAGVISPSHICQISSCHADAAIHMFGNPHHTPISIQKPASIKIVNSSI